MYNISPAHKNFLQSIFFALVVVLPVTASEKSADSFAESKGITIKVLSPLSYKNLEEMWLGFNMELGQTQGAKGDYKHEGIVESTKAIRVGTLRYPGGTPANYFDWKSETLDKEAVKRYGNKHIKRLLQRQLAEGGGHLPQASMKSFTELCIERKINPHVVLNFFQPDQEIIASIDKFKDLFPGKVRWEFGNEISYKYYEQNVEIDGESWTAQLYARKAEIILSYIKKKYVDDEVGIVVSDIAAWRNPKSVKVAGEEKRRMSWDSSVKSVVKNADAVIIHPYIYAQKNIIRLLEPPSGFWKDKGRMPTKESWVFSGVSLLPSLYMMRLSNRFGDKPIWITEIAIFGDSGKNKNERANEHTWLRTLSLGSYMINWLANYPRVQSMHVHGLFVGYGWGHALYPDLSLTSNGLAFELVSHFISDSGQISNMELSESIDTGGLGRFEGKNVPMVTGLIKKTTNSFQALIINLSDMEHTLELFWNPKSIKVIDKALEDKIAEGEYKDLASIPQYPLGSRVVKIKPRSISQIN